jgi:hypothetical protein
VICLGIRCGYRESHRKLRPLSVFGYKNKDGWGGLQVYGGLVVRARPALLGSPVLLFGYSGGGILGCVEDC